VEVLRTVLEVAGSTVVHCCAPSPPVALLRRAGASAVSLDATLLTPRDDDALGEAVEAGARLLLGLVPSRDGVLSDPSTTMTSVLAPATALWRRSACPPRRCPRPWCHPHLRAGGREPGRARRALQACVEGARRLPELVSGGSGEEQGP
jgi:hypothetical protein